MQYLDQPHFKKEGNIFILYKLNFSTTDEPGFSEHTSVASGAAIEIGRFGSREDLQHKCLKLFGVEAKEIGT